MGKSSFAKILITGLAVACLVVGFIFGVVVKERTIQDANDVSVGPYNALFNVSPAGEVGLWIYSVNGECPDLRLKDRNPLVIVVSASKRGDPRIGFSELAACTELRLEGVRTPGAVSCIAGFIQFHDTPDKKVKRGSYAMTLSDGAQRSGDFLGTYCEPEVVGSTR
jgi:hypothetical protein